MALATALAAPVDEGMMLPLAQRPPRQSLFEDASTTFWVADMAWPLVVHDAQLSAFIDESYVSSLTPMTTVGESSLAGAKKMIFFAPAPRCASTFSAVRNAPVDSQMYSAPMAVNGISAGSRVWDVGVRTRSIMRPSSTASTVPGRRPMRPKPLMPPATAIWGAAPEVARTGAAAGRLDLDVVNAEAPVTRRAAEVYFIVMWWDLMRRGVSGFGW